MLQTLRIENLAIISEAHIDFHEGFNVLTGETGAGKSILLDALGLLAGRRASSADIRSGEKQAVVEAVISDPSQSFKVFLSNVGIEIDNEVVIRRIISMDGKNKVFINASVFHVSGLSELAPLWIDQSTQHAQQKLLQTKTHQMVLDQVAGSQKELDQYTLVFEQAQEQQKKIEAFKAFVEKINQDREFYAFQLKELKDAALRDENEEELLKAKLGKFTSGEKLIKSIGACEVWMEGESGVLSLMKSIQKELLQASKHDESLGDLIAQVENGYLQIQEVSLKLGQYSKSFDLNPSEIEAMNERLMLLQKIKRKYGSIGQALETYEKLKVTLGEMEISELNEKDLLAKQKEIFKNLLAADEILQSKRKKSASKFSMDVMKGLRNLGMEQATFEVAFEPVGDEGGLSFENKNFNASGSQKVEFMFAPNPGEGLRPLKAIASGGELSRLLLALKTIEKKQQRQGFTVVLDEVDTGVSGKTAEQVGILQKQLALGAQVLCVTHLAQVACYGDSHFLISKSTVGQRTKAQVKNLNASERKAELARMLGGIEITPAVKAHAAELLERGA